MIPYISGIVNSEKKKSMMNFGDAKGDVVVKFEEKNKKTLKICCKIF